jgi:hypothetical protein
MVRLNPTHGDNAQVVSPGQWIRVQIPDTWPLHMQIGRGSMQPAFLHREARQTFAQVRCPPLGPGTYPVIVKTPASIIETTVVVQ